MQTHSTQQEILLFTGTSFSSRNWMDKDASAKTNHLSSVEQLEEACWNGLVTQILPEICERPGDVQMTLWEIHVANSFLDLKFSEYPDFVEREFSVDPYIFLPVQALN